MQNNYSDSPNEEAYSKPLNISKENIVCEDGFCSIPNKNEESRVNKQDLNLFDPI